MNHVIVLVGISTLLFAVTCCSAQEKATPKNPVMESKIQVIGSEVGWKELGAADFVNVNCQEDTWEWRDGVLYCKGDCVGVYRTKEGICEFRVSRPLAPYEIRW